MTVSPEQPKLQDCQEEGKKVLTEPHLTFVYLGLGYSLMVYIGKGFVTDGASVPKNILSDKDYGPYFKTYLFRKYPKIGTRLDLENLWDKIVGKPWDMPRLLAAIVHDALYSYKWKLRWFCDWIYRKILIQNDYDRIRADVEYTCIGLEGWKHWNAKSDLDRDRAREIIKIEIIRTKKTSKIIRSLQGKNGREKKIYFFPKYPLESKTYI